MDFGAVALLPAATPPEPGDSIAQTLPGMRARELLRVSVADTAARFR